MPVKIAVLKETRPHERRVAMVPAVADKLAKLGAEIHLQSGAGTAVKLPDQAFKNVRFHTSLSGRGLRYAFTAARGSATIAQQYGRLTGRSS